jgi:hypothetical protein
MRDNMKDKNPDYEKSQWSYKKRIATKCRICGEQLLLPEEMKKEIHSNCDNNLSNNTYLM